LRARGWALVAALLIALGAFEPFYLRVYRFDRAKTRAMLVALPYRKSPSLRPFLQEVSKRTDRTDAIAIFAPLRNWTDGYDYIFGHASYVLAGRRVIPLMDMQSRVHPENLGAAKYIAAYGGELRVPGFVPVWRGDGGVLLKRKP
jgi:hypothetical protein